MKENYVARLDADDVADFCRIEKQIEFMQKYQLDFVMSGADFIDEEGVVSVGDDMPMLLSEDINNIVKYGNPSIHSSWFLKKQVYDSLGGYREVKYCEDYEFVLRALQNNVKIGRMKEHLIMYRLHQSSISMRYAKEQYEKTYFLRKMYIMEKPIIQMDYNKINEKFSKYSEYEKGKFAEAKYEIDLFCNCLYKRKYLKCIKITVRGFLKNSDYRKVFFRSLKANIRMRRFYNSLSYL